MSTESLSFASQEKAFSWEKHTAWVEDKKVAAAKNWRGISFAVLMSISSFAFVTDMVKNLGVKKSSDYAQTLGYGLYLRSKEENPENKND